MIVDLVRNDFGRVSQFGSVKVDAYPRLETLPHLHHLIADISAQLIEGKNLVDLIKACFPCASVTGAPKIAAMQIISELEQEQRGIYTGAIGWIDSKGDSRWSVPIRTAVISKGQLIFRTGGGITIDSESQSEYNESLIKARGLFLAYHNCLQNFN